MLQLMMILYSRVVTLARHILRVKCWKNYLSIFSGKLSLGCTDTVRAVVTHDLPEWWIMRIPDIW